MSTIKTWLRRTLLGSAAFALMAIPASVSHAQSTATKPNAVSQEIRPALWKISDEDTTIWLFGTIHILPQSVDWYKGPVASALDTAQELVTEIAMGDDKAAANAMLQKSLREDGKALRDTLTPNERRAYEHALAALKIPPQAFDNHDTWFSALMLTMIPLQHAGYNPNNGIDTQVAKKAASKGIPNIALETADFQINIFENLPQEDQIKYLNEIIKSSPNAQKNINAMTQAWKDGDADRLAELLNEDESTPIIRKALLTDRNATWAQWLKNRLDQPGNVFVAVGAGHLAGEGSVQEILAAHGIPSTRVQ